MICAKPTPPSPPAPTDFVPAALGLTLLLYVPLPTFFRYLDWSALSFEGLVLFAAFAATSAAVVAPAAVRRRLPLAVVYGFGLLWAIDFQARPFVGKGWYLVGLAGCTLVCWLLSKELAKLSIVVCGIASLLSIFWAPQGPRGDATTDADPTLPPILHLILDEHIGLAGMPSTPRGAAVAEGVRSAYLDRGFRIYEQAFSLHDQTGASIASVLDGREHARERVAVNSDNTVVRYSRHLERLAERGYIVQVYQTDTIDLCQFESVPIESCQTDAVFRLSIPLSQMAPFSPERIRHVAALVTLRSRLAGRFESVYRERLRPLVGVLPEWPRLPTRGPEPSLYALDDLTGSALKEARGRVFLAHLMMPHSPWVLTSDCGRQPPEAFHESAPIGTRYFDQVECTTRRVMRALDRMLQEPEFQDATVFIHGDHGVRVPIVPEDVDAQPGSEAWLRFTFSTFAAIRAPHVEAGSTHEPLAVNQIVAEHWYEEPLDLSAQPLHSSPQPSSPTSFALPPAWRNEPATRP